MPLIGDLSGSLGKNSLIGVTGSIDISYDGEGTEDGWIQFQEMTGDPSTPAANHGKIYAKDTGGVTIPYFIDASGTVTSLLSGGSGGSGSPAGSDTQLQFNDGGSFGASANLTWDDTELKISGTGTNTLLNLQTTEDSSTASPVLELTRVSSSPADADYLGQVKFVGRHDGNGATTYAKITGKIDDASDSSEDGILEFANIKNGSQTVTARLRSDSLQLLNSTNLSVDGTAEISQYLYHKDDNDTYVKFEDDVITLTAGTAASIQLRESSYDHIMINSSMNDVDTYIYGQNMNRTLFKGIAQQNNEQVLILSGGAAGSINTASGDDVAFFVSGSVGVKDSGTKGASVFGGDLITSGTSWHMNNLVVEDIDANEQGIITIGDTTASAYTTITTSQYGRVTVQSRRNGRDGEIWLDSSDDIILDVESGGTLEMREASVSLLKITPNSSNIDIQPQVANKDIRIASQSGNTLLTADSSDEAIKIDRKLGLGMTTLMSTGTLSADHPVVMIANAGSSDVTGTLSDPTFSGQMKVVVGMKMSSGECILSYKNPAGTTTNKTLINGVGVLLCGFEMTPGSYRWFTVGDVT
tara:strand:+ start:514 stop:2265 length:1752 start_codon:yes stop_codon:yes gene_type:complete